MTELSSELGVELVSTPPLTESELSSALSASGEGRRSATAGSTTGGICERASDRETKNSVQAASAFVVGTSCIKLSLLDDPASPKSKLSHQCTHYYWEILSGDKVTHEPYTFLRKASPSSRSNPENSVGSSESGWKVPVQNVTFKAVPLISARLVIGRVRSSGWMLTT